MSPNKQFKVIIKGKVLYSDLKITIYSKKCSIYIIEERKNEIKVMLPISFLKKIFCCNRLLIRLFRLEPRLAIKLRENYFLVSVLGKIYCLEKWNKSWILTLEHTFRVGMNNPLGMVKICGIKNISECVVYGEYWKNALKEPVKIIKREEGRWSTAYEFPPNTITHIHGIVPDQKRQCVYILTGDDDSESGIWEAKNNFSEVNPIILGKQIFRSCVAFPVNEGLLYATDTPLEKNFIILLFLEGQQRGKIKKLYPINGSCIYGSRIVKDNSEYFVISTSVEGDSRKSGFKYLLSRRRGPGILSDEVHCLCMKGINSIPQLLGSFKKDFWPYIFQFGSVTFPSDSKKYIYGTPIGVRRYDGKTIEFFLN